MSKSARATRARGRVSLVLAALVAVAFLAACQPAPPAGTVSAEGSNADAWLTQVIFDRVNADRAANGLGPLRWNVQLADLARDHTDYMAATGDFSHRDLVATIRLPYFAGYAWLGENILVGPGTMSGDAIENAWMNSPDHRANILSPNFDSIGIAVGWGPDDRIWATQDFGGSRR